MTLTATLLAASFALGGKAATTGDEQATTVALAADTLRPETPDTSLIRLHGDTLRPTAPDTLALTKKELRAWRRQHFIPNPKRALWLALVLPGAGQIYNRKYWKLPIFYGGFLGCTYALLWNQQMYHDYQQAYLDIMDSDPDTKSYLNMLPPNYDTTGKEERLKTLFKNRKDRYRRYRDMSAFAFIGVYLLSVVDAYVDAELSVFDISPDLSMRVEPAIINQRGNGRTSSAYGIGCSLRF